jgi:hypothetical protein
MKLIISIRFDDVEWKDFKSLVFHSSPRLSPKRVKPRGFQSKIRE